MATRFINCRIAKKDGTLELGEVWILENQIIDAQRYFFEGRDALETIDIGGNIIAPGFIDSQINGAYSVDFSILEGLNDGDYLAGLDRVSARLPESGVTSFVPTIITQKASLYPRLLSLLKPRSIPGSAHVLGYHAEGPFLFPEKKGAHTELLLQSAEEEVVSLERAYGNAGLDQAGVKIITLAPDVNGILPSITKLTERGVTVSIGHTAANFDLSSQAIKNGARLVTHLFNAMPTFNHRDPGVLGAVLGEKKSSYGIICDGIHVHPSAVKFAYDAHPAGVILVTDAMPLMDPNLKDGKHSWRDNRCIMKEGLKLTIEGTETLAGSAIALDHCVRNLKKFANISLSQAIQAATWNVAQLLKLEKKGSLEAGFDADMVVLDEEGFVLSTWIMGKKVWSREK